MHYPSNPGCYLLKIFSETTIETEFGQSPAKCETIIKDYFNGTEFVKLKDFMKDEKKYYIKSWKPI